MKLSNEEKKDIIEVNQDSSFRKDMKSFGENIPKMTFREYLDFLTSISSSDFKEFQSNQIEPYRKVIF